MTEEKKYVPPPTPSNKTPEELWEEELVARKKDMEDAVIAEREASEKVAALPPPFTDVFEYWGVGPLAYETKRGFIKVLSGDIVCKFEYVDPDIPDVIQTEVVVLSIPALEALQAANIPPDPPVGLAVRAERIGAKRRGELAPKPTNPIVKPDLGKPLGVPKPTQLPAK